MSRVVLTGTGGEWEGRRFVFAGREEVVVGRSADCALPLGDPLVSRRHCLLDAGGEWAWVRDLGSRNGTYVNGRLIGRRPEAGEGSAPGQGAFLRLRPGDELRIGSGVFQVAVTPGEAAEGEAGQCA
jgi:pSer/pThr/pTyr-binding forkhead associated (FHA) protein